MDTQRNSRFSSAALFSLIVTLFAVLAGNTVADAQNLDLGLDHFKCYRVTEGEPANAFVQLQDQFDVAVGTPTNSFFEHVVVRDPLLFCNPVKKILASGAVTPILNENNHLKMYLIAPTFGQQRTVLVSNQFDRDGQVQPLIVFQPVILAVPTQKRPHGPPERLDHFKCYFAEGPSVNIPLGLVDQFDKEQVRVGRPILLCNPTVKIHGETATSAANDLGDIVTPITNPDAHLVCYRIISPPRTPTTSAFPFAARQGGRGVEVLNQFGKEELKVTQPVVLCVPSTKTLPG
jgi:hypothetical protein